MHSRRRFLMLGERAPASVLPDAAYARRARVGDECLSARGTVCRTCGEHCEPQAIRFQLLPAGKSRPVISGERCNACGECVRVCPAQAMSLQVVATTAA